MYTAIKDNKNVSINISEKKKEGWEESPLLDAEGYILGWKTDMGQNEPLISKEGMVPKCMGPDGIHS